MAHIDYFFSVFSPWTYLGGPRFAEIAARHGASVTWKPLDLLAYPIQNSTQANAIVLDTFAGSGSTLMACEKLGMKARLSELDAGYVDVIVNRWQNYTGKVAVLESANTTYAEVADIRQATVEA